MKPLHAMVAALLVGKTAHAQDVSSADPVLGAALILDAVGDGQPTAPVIRGGSRARRATRGTR